MKWIITIKEILFKKWVDLSEVSAIYYKFRLWYKRNWGDFNYIMRIYNEKYKLVFHDDFKTVDRTKWNIGQEWGRVHPMWPHQYSDASCIEVVNDNLWMTVKHRPEQGTQWVGQEDEFYWDIKYAHGDMETKHKFHKGIFEIRCIVPDENNIVTAFWLSGNDTQEIDIFEFFPECFDVCDCNPKNKEQKITVHWDSTNGRRMSPKDYKLPIKIRNSMNTYTLIWEDDRMEFLFNGITIRKITNKKLLAKFTNPAGIIIGTGLDKDPLVNNIGYESLPLIVDYIKIWQK